MRSAIHSSYLHIVLLLVSSLLFVGPLMAQEEVAFKCLWQKAGQGKDYFIQSKNNQVAAEVASLTSTGIGWVLEPASGFVRIKLQADPGLYLHNQNGRLELGPIQPNWWSAQWTLEPVGNNFRIKNRWKPTEYLNIQGPNLAVGPIQPNWWSAIWVKVPHTERAQGSSNNSIGNNVRGESTSQTAGNSIAEYIRNLDYNPLKLLSVKEDGSTESLPANGSTERDSMGNRVIICKKVPRKLDKKMDKISILKPTAGVIYPGALILANRKMSEGLPTPITLPKAPLTLRIDLPGLTNNGSVTINDPKNSNVQSAINGLLEEWNRNSASEGYVNASNSISRIEKAYSSQQVSVELGFRAEWASNSVSAATKVNNSNETNVTVAFFQQVFYTVSMDSPERPADVFSNATSLADIRGVINNDNPPAYVRSVDYGRTIMVRMETNKQETEVDLEAAMKYATAGGTTFEGNLAAKYKSILSNSTFTVYTVGGNAEVSAQIVGGTDLSKLQSIIQQDARYRRNNPGVPIAYTVAFLKDNSIASVQSASDYVETNCTEYPNGFIKLQHSGGYVGRFRMTWLQPNKNGIIVPKFWTSGDKTAGYSQTISLPGDAKSVNIIGEAYTGLVWDPVGEAMNITVDGPTNCTYTITGTTLNRSYNKSNCPE